MDRRGYLVTGLATCLGGLAGCVGNGNGGGSNERDTPTATDEDTPTATDESIRYGALYTYDRDYKIDIDYTDPDSNESGTAVARYHGADHYVRAMPDGSNDVYELYEVDDTTYVVINEQEC